MPGNFSEYNGALFYIPERKSRDMTVKYCASPKDSRMALYTVSQDEIHVFRLFVLPVIDSSFALRKYSINLSYTVSFHE